MAETEIEACARVPCLIRVEAPDAEPAADVLEERPGGDGQAPARQRKRIVSAIDDALRLLQQVADVHTVVLGFPRYLAILTIAFLICFVC